MKVNTEPATGTQLDSKMAHSTIRPAALDSIAKLAQNTVLHRVSPHTTAVGRTAYRSIAPPREDPALGRAADTTLGYAHAV
jgi:hypothetical protein